MINLLSLTSSSEKIIEENYSWVDIEYLVRILGRKVSESGKIYDAIIGIANGGIIPARLLARELAIENIMFIYMSDKVIQSDKLPFLESNKRYLIVDDIYDQGTTYNKIKNFFAEYDFDYAFLISRYNKNMLSARVLNHSRWIVFPWE